MDYQNRIAKVQARLRRQKLDAVLISQPENRRYLCGYTGEDHGIAETSGLLLIPAKGQVRLLTDFRYQLQAERDVPWAEVLLYPKGLLKLLENLLPQLGIARLGFESRYTLHDSALKMAKSFEKRGIHITPLTDWIEDLRLIKDEAEIARIKKSVQLNEAVFHKIYQNIETFNTELEVATAIETTMRQMGASRPSFSSIVACGPNGALPHAVPGNAPIVPEMSLTVDMGLVLDGYCSDMTRTFVIGKPSEKYCTLHRIVRKAQLAGIAAVRDGIRACDVDRAARKVIEDAGYGKYFGHSLGHGVGLAVHEDPRLSTRNKKKLRTGMVVTVEPGIYLPDWGGIRLENMVVVRPDGCENLNTDTTWLDI